MVSEADIVFLRELKVRCLAGTPKSWLRGPERTLLEHSDWKTVQESLEGRLIEQPGGEPGERYVLCRSEARAEKERAMLARQSERLTKELIKIDAWLRRAPQADREAVGRRIARHLGNHPAAAAIVVTDVIHGAGGRTVGLRVNSRRGRRAKSAPAKGRVSLAHQLRGDRSGLVVEVVYPAHAGRGGVPHRQERPGPAAGVSPTGGPGAGAHFGVLPGLGALARPRTVEQAKGLGTCARQLVRKVVTIKSVDVIVPVKRAGMTRDHSCAG
jgi:hypothetical protein